MEGCLTFWMPDAPIPSSLTFMCFSAALSFPFLLFGDVLIHKGGNC